MLIVTYPFIKKSAGGDASGEIVPKSLIKSFAFSKPAYNTSYNKTNYESFIDEESKTNIMSDTGYGATGLATLEVVFTSPLAIKHVLFQPLKRNSTRNLGVWISC